MSGYEFKFGTIIPGSPHTFMSFREWFSKIFNDSGSNGNMDDVVTTIIVKGKRALLDPLKQGSLPRAQMGIFRQLRNVEDDKERVRIVSANFPIWEFLDGMKAINGAIGKDDEVANLFRRKSMDYYDEGHHELALRSIQLACVFTSADSDFWGTIFADRAKCLCAVGKFNGAIENIECSIDLEMPQQVRLDLEEAKQNCKDALHYMADAKMLEYKTYCDEVLFKLGGVANPIIPSAANYLRIANKVGGHRRIITVQDLAPGTTILIENPYVSVLKEEMKFKLHYCGGCHQYKHCMFGCSGCIFMMYCHEECFVKDQNEGHKYECGAMSFLQAIDDNVNLSLAFKAICRAGPKHLYGLYKAEHHNGVPSPPQGDPQEDPPVNPQGNPPEIVPVNPPVNPAVNPPGPSASVNIGYIPGTRYGSEDFDKIMKLIGIQDPKYQNYSAFAVIPLVKLLEVNTSFFDTIAEGHKEAFRKYLAETILSLMVAIPYNAMYIWRDCEPNYTIEEDEDLISPIHLGGKEVIEEGVEKEFEETCLMGLFALICLINHSCDPNSQRITLREGKTAIVTNRNIKAGEEITISYGYEFRIHDAKYRKDYMEADGITECDCLACVQKWPILKKFTKKLTLLCPDCHNKFTYDQHAMEGKARLNDIKPQNQRICLNCSMKFDLVENDEELKSYLFKYSLAELSVEQENPLEAVEPLIECINYFQRRLCPPNAPFINAVSTLAKAYKMISSKFKF